MDPADIDQIKADVLEFRRLLEAAGEYVPSPTTLDPDLMRAVHMFNKWTTEVIGGNLKGGGGPFDAVLKNIAGMPTTNAVPYNYTEHMMLEQIAQAMRDKFDDAHRLHYYARSRNMLERSVNHPFFGIYPASYMWGKMLPEMIRFVAKEPFGVKTGAMAYTLLDVQKAVMMQREFDPEFDKMMEKMGHSAMMFALSYMVPALPWDVNANWSAWLRTFAQQGMDMEARIASGGNISDSSGVAGTGLDPSQPIQRVVDTMNPLKAMERTFVDPLQETTDKGDDEEEDKYGGTYKYSLKGGDTLQGTELGDPLNDVMKQLQSLFGG